MNGEPLLILLVEDDLAHAEIVRRNLDESHAGTRLVHVRDGQSALDYLFRQGVFADPGHSLRPDLILLDLRLPRVDGLEVLAQVKKDPGLRHIPIVVLTTSDAEGDILDSYEFGAGSYLVKSLEFDEVIKQMDAFCLYWLAWNRFPAGPPCAR
jgi:CheY-like chemotaxis protein